MEYLSFEGLQLYDKKIKAYINSLPSIKIDDKLDANSTNTLQNKVIAQEIGNILSIQSKIQFSDKLPTILKRADITDFTEELSNDNFQPKYGWKIISPYGDKIFYTSKGLTNSTQLFLYSKDNGNEIELQANKIFSLTPDTEYFIYSKWEEPLEDCVLLISFDCDKVSKNDIWVVKDLNYNWKYILIPEQEKFELLGGTTDSSIEELKNQVQELKGDKTVEGSVLNLINKALYNEDGDATYATTEELNLAITELENKINVPIATKELGLVKSSDDDNFVSVKEDGTMEVNKVNVNKLVQDEDEDFILCGGQAN